MLAAHRAAELDDQVGDLARDRPERLDPLSRLDVDDRPDVQAADVGVAVAGAVDPVPLDDRAEPLVELRASCRGSTAVSSTNAIGLASPTMPIRSEKPALRTFQKSSLAASARRLRTPSTPGPSLEPAGQVVGARRPARPASRRRTARPGRRRGGPRRSSRYCGVERVLRRPARGSSGRASRRRPGPVATISRQPVERRGDRREREHDQPLRRGERHDLQLGRGDDRQRPLRADDQPRQVELPGLVAPARRPDRQAGDELVEVVAADPPEDLREPRRDRRLDAAPTVSRTTRWTGPTDQVRGRQHGVELVGRDGPKRRRRAVGQDDVDRPDVIDRLAVPQRAAHRPSCCRSSRRSSRGRSSRRRARTSGRAASGGH